MATDETVVIECDECGAIFAPEKPTKSISKAITEAAEDGWSHVIDPFEVDWCPDCTITKINARTCANYAKCKKLGFCHASCWTPKEKKGEKGTTYDEARYFTDKLRFEARIKELEAKSLKATNSWNWYKGQTTRLQADISKLHKERDSWNNIANKHAKEQHRLEEDLKKQMKVVVIEQKANRQLQKELDAKTRLMQVNLKRAQKDEMVIADLKGHLYAKGKKRVEVDKKGEVVYCEYADQCPSAIEASKVEKPKPKDPKETYYECPKCGWVGPESDLFTEETSGDAYCPKCISVECKKIKRPKCHKCDDTGWEKTPHPRDGITVPCDCPAGTRMRIKNGWLKKPKKKRAK